MITVTKEQMKEVEYLIHQSIQGNHILFDAQEIREILTRSPHSPQFDVDFSYQMEPHIERLMTLPTLAQKRAYLEKLEPLIYAGVVIAYFNIVENHLLELNPKRELCH